MQRTERHEDRVALYRDALDHRFEPAERLELFHTMAGLQRDALKRPDEAIDTYRLALDADERDARALDALTDLYQSRERWDDLGELYLRRAEQAESPNAGAVYRLALSRLHKKLGQKERAVDQLEAIVSEVPTPQGGPGRARGDAGRRALEGARGRDPAAPLRVCRRLAPLDPAQRGSLQARERHREGERAPRDRRAVGEAGQRPDRARRALEAAVHLDPEDGALRGEYERLVEQTEAWTEAANTYEAVLEEKPDLNSKRDVLAVLARLHDEKRDDPRAALLAYERLHRADESELEPVAAMERLATLLSDWPALVRVLVDKAELVLEDGERASIWRHVGEVRRDMLDERDGAINAYERAAELEPDSSFTVDCLIELYEQKGDPARLVELYQRRVELSGEDDADLKYELLTASAKRYETELGDRPRAIDVLTQALAARPADRPADRRPEPPVSG